MGLHRRRIISYIAMSLDGKIARLNGAVDWLEAIPNPDSNDYGYGKFMETIDTTIMGRSTYDEVLGYNIPFPYSDKTNFVLSRDVTKRKDNNVSFVSEELGAFIENLRNQEGLDIWLIGGGQLNSLFLKNAWLDEMRVFVMPIVLGEGIPLFSPHISDTHLQHIKTIPYISGVNELIYKPKKS